MATYDVSVSDGVGLSEALTCGFQYSVAVSDGVGLAETLAEKAVFSEAITDTIGLAETLSEKAVFKEAVTDGVGLAETDERYLRFGAGVLAGYYAIEETDLARYELWVGTDAAPDLTANATENFTENPHNVVLAVGHDYYIVLRTRDKYGLLSQNIEQTRFTLDADGDLAYEPPSSPDYINVIPAATGNVTITAVYNITADGTNVAANQWRIYLTDDGSTPDSGDLLATVSMTETDLATLNYTTTANYTDGATIKVLVKVRRSGDGVESENTTIYSTTANSDGPTLLDGEMTIGGRA